MLLAAGLLVVVIAALDRSLPYGVPLSFLYLLPMAMVGAVGSRGQVLLAAVLCTAVSEFSDNFSWTASEGVPRDLLSLFAFAAEGLYLREALLKRRAESLHIAALQTEVGARREAEQQLSLLIGSSALAIITLDSQGVVVQANGAAHSMLGDGAEARKWLLGRNIAVLLPALGRVFQRSRPERPLRTMMQTQGFREDGTPFLAEVWFSTFETTEGARTAAMIVDASEDLRDREESALEQLLNSSRLAVGAVAHEIRNVSSAIQLVQRNLLTLSPALAATPDFLALQQLTSTLERVASVETSLAKRTLPVVALHHYLEELRIVAQATLRECDIALDWQEPDSVPPVWADQHGLMQAFLNVVRNARAALTSTPEPRVAVRVERTGSTVCIRISDNGPGVAEPEELFRPFWGSRAGAGFGLYLSRAILNSFQADISHEQGDCGATFVIALQAAAL